MLHSMVKTGTNAQFTYDHNGLRIKKVVNNVTTSYTLNGKSIVHMTQGNNDLHFFYDAQGKPAMVRFNGTDYFYVYNLQSDVVGMIDTNGTLVVEYVYDAWGAPIAKTGTLAATLGTLNPFRYRGYVYDEETGLYYLRSRYYHPVWKRFVNADNRIVSGNFGNTFCYCQNCPLLYLDSNGDLFEKLTGLIKNRVRHHLSAEDKMTNLEFIQHLRQMADEKWKYDYGHAEYKIVDCVGVYKYIMNWYYTWKDFGYIVGINKYSGKPKFNQVSDMVTYGLAGDVSPISSDFSNLSEGMAVFIFDPNESKSKSKGWMHVGYYIGETEFYEHTVVEAKGANYGVVYSDLAESEFNYCGMLIGIEYRMIE